MIKHIATLLLPLLMLLHPAIVRAETVEINGRSFTLSENVLLLTHEKHEPSPYVYSSPIDVFKAIDSSKSRAVTLLVAPSVYWLDDPDDPSVRRNPHDSGKTPYAVEVACDTLEIIGLADDPMDVVFAVNRGQTQGALGNYTMLHFTGKSLSVANITMGNYCNVDLEYPRNPSLNRTRRRDAIVQAQVGICKGTDRLLATNCRFISRLNLCPLVGARRSLYRDCYFECTDDALSGSAIYQDCRFTFHSGKPFYSTSATGAVFLNCDIHSLVNGTQYFTKMPGMVTVIDTRFTSDQPIELRWTRDESPVRCYQSNVTLNGKPVTIDADRPHLSADITSSPLLRAFKISTGENTVLYNIPNLTAGTDGWDPTGTRKAVETAQQATGVQLLSLPVALRLTPSSRQLKSTGDTVTIQASPRLWGDYDSSAPLGQATWETPSVLTLTSVTDHATAVSNNTYPTSMQAPVSVKTASGLIGAVNLSIDPELKEAPIFAKSPSITRDKSTLRLDYTLSGDENDDHSHIVWYRWKNPDRSDSIAVRHGNGTTARTYPLTPADKGYNISASIMPRHSDSHGGTPVHIQAEKPITQNMIGLLARSERSLTTSFAEIPLRRRDSHGTPGVWNFDTYKPLDTSEHDWKPDPVKSWYYGTATDAATGTGLVQATRGARLSYTPARQGCSSMTLDLTAEPCKGPGQGFGSATGQYMDICVKFDPVTLTGYALRIERTPDYDKAVTFTLMRYTDGHVTPLTEPVASSCFRAPCHISIEITDSRLLATARTEAPGVTPSDPAVKPHVMISAPVTPSSNTSLMIQHTGSAGASATLLRNLTLGWK